MDNYINIVDIIKYLENMTGCDWYLSNAKTSLASLSHSSEMSDHVYRLLQSNNISYEIGYLAVYVKIPDILSHMRDNKINSILNS